MSKCKGVFYKYVESKHYPRSRGIEFRKEIVFQEDLSCPGCKECDWTKQINDNTDFSHTYTLSHGAIYLAVMQEDTVHFLHKDLWEAYL